MRQDYYSVLARVIAATAQDEAQLRQMVYELARVKLRRQLLLQIQHLGRAELDKEVLAFETAIEQIELDVAENAVLLSLPPGPARNGYEALRPEHTDLILHQQSFAAAALDSRLEAILAPVAYSPSQRIEPARALPPLSEIDGQFSFSRPSRSLRSKFWFGIQLAFAIMLGVAIYAVFEKQPSALPGLTGWRLVRETTQPPDQQRIRPDNNAQAPHPPIQNIPVPASYGVYAVDGRKLTELGPLPIRVPDPRVSISGIISTPSSAILPDGRLQFVVFRRDLRTSAPDTVMVRVVAEVKRALTFIGGKATIEKVEGAWAVRGISYAMQVSPVDGNPEMIVIRPPTASFSFPPGRYALVLKSLAYDFTVDGPVTDLAHCLERTDALDAPIYSKCRKP